VPRRIPENRLKELLTCATRVFVAQGYRQTQMADVAASMGVAKGTVYLYVESKEALFAACVRHADGEPPALSELTLPLATPSPGALVAELQVALARESTPRALATALARECVSDVRAELEQVVRELFAIAQRHRTVIKLMDRCGRDHPELAAVFYDRGRFAQVEQLTRYLDSRIERGALRPVPVAAVAARFIVETIVTWAVHMHWDPAPQSYRPVDAEATVVQFLLGGLLPERAA
jgi:AcrR family transcriptional regulator